MKRFNRFFILMLCFIFAFSSCNNKQSNQEDHQHKYSTKYTAGNCITYGYTTYSCDCGDYYVVRDQNYGNHMYSLSYTIDVRPTTSSTGIKSRHCIYCNHSIDEQTIPKLESDLPIINP